MARTAVMGLPYPDWLAGLDGFRDVSWKNDETDSLAFSVAGRPYRLWVAPEDPAEREGDQQERRFGLVPLVGAAPEGLLELMDEDGDGRHDLETEGELREVLRSLGAAV